MPPCTAPHDLVAAFLSRVFAVIDQAIVCGADTAVNAGNQVGASSAVPRRAPKNLSRSRSASADGQRLRDDDLQAWVGSGSSLINCRPRELLADRAHHILRNPGTLERRILCPQLPDDRTARLPHRADDAIQRRVWSLDDALQARPRCAVPLQILSLGLTATDRAGVRLALA